MTNHKILTREQFVSMPWKNGKGETLELLHIQDEAGTILRISQAMVVEAGEFSDFSSLERHLVLIKGNGIDLTHKSANAVKQHELKQLLDIAVFDGGDVTYAELRDGPITDLNIMVRAHDYKVQVSSVYASEVYLNPITAQRYFYANQESVMLCNAVEENLLLPKNSLLTMGEVNSYSLRSGNGVLISFVVVDPVI
ncbi:MAG: environmental stress-induced protein Ves [Oceanospirillaceae bacterium]|jgi:environmental stress-induced protein Ves